LSVNRARPWGGQPDVRLRGVCHGYGSVTVLEGLDLDLPAQGYLALMGASGAGMSTTLAVIGGLERPQRGGVVVGGQDLGRQAAPRRCSASCSWT
jgi:ABC-type Fe3+/spermidine/putrescine transport system ATPase subunit